jgi:hypothetical protein
MSPGPQPYQDPMGFPSQPPASPGMGYGAMGSPQPLGVGGMGSPHMGSPHMGSPQQRRKDPRFQSGPRFSVDSKIVTFEQVCALRGRFALGLPLSCVGWLFSGVLSWIGSGHGQDAAAVA